MNWFSQVWHVAVKDIRRSRWALIVYSALIAASTASIVTGRAFGPYSLSPTTQTLGMPDIFVVYLPIISVILGLVASASVLQLDSPTRPNAFWASRPLTPTAVLAAKLVVVMITIVALPLIGVAIGLASLDAGAVTTTRLIAGCAISYAEWALAVLIVSALTDDLRGSAVALIAILFGTVIVVSAFAPTSMGASRSSVTLTALGTTVIGVVGGIALLAFLYRTRDKRSAAWIMGVVVASSLVVASFIGLPSALRAPTLGGSTAQLVLQQSGTAPRQLSMRIAPSRGVSSVDERAVFQADSVTVELIDGQRIKVGHSPRTTILLTRPQLGAPISWLDHNPVQSEGSLSIELPAGARRGAIGNSAKSVSVDGTITSFRSREIATLALRTGASIIRTGRRIVIYGFSHDATGVDLWVQVSALPRDLALDNADPGSVGDLRLAIVNDRRSEAILLSNQSGGTGSGSLVLPWLQIYTSFSRLSNERASEDLPLDDSWYAGAHVAVLEWGVVGRTRARGEVALR